MHRKKGLHLEGPGRFHVGLIAFVFLQGFGGVRCAVMGALNGRRLPKRLVLNHHLLILYNR